MARQKNLPNIIFISGLHSGGSEKVTAEVANHLSSNKLANVYLASIVYGERFYSYDENINIFQSRKLISLRGKVFSLFNLLYALRQLLSYCKQIKPDVLVGFITMNNVFAILIAKLLKKPVIISCRNNPSKIELPYYLLTLRRKLYKNASLMILQTDLTKQLFRDLTIPLPESKVIENLIDEKYFNVERKESEEKYILNVGSLSSQKNQKELIEIFSEIVAPEYKLLILGEGDLRIELESYIRSKNLEERVILMGKRKNLVPFYESATIFAFTSLFEGFPNALAEAMICAVPCISYDCKTGPSEMIENGINGILIEPRNRDAFVKNLQQLVNDTELREKLSNNAHYIRQKLNRENLKKDWTNTLLAFAHEK